MVFACNNIYLTIGHAGFLNNVSITFIDKTDPSDPLEREGYCRHTLKTMAPFGLNIEKSVQRFEVLHLLTGVLWHICQSGPARF